MSAPDSPGGSLGPFVMPPMSPLDEGPPVRPDGVKAAATVAVVLALVGVALCWVGLAQVHRLHDGGTAVNGDVSATLAVGLVMDCLPVIACAVVWWRRWWARMAGLAVSSLATATGVVALAQCLVIGIPYVLDITVLALLTITLVLGFALVALLNTRDVVGWCRRPTTAPR